MFKDIIEVFHEIAVAKGFKPLIFVTAATKFSPLVSVGVDATAWFNLLIKKKDYLDYKELKEAAKNSAE